MRAILTFGSTGRSASTAADACMLVMKFKGSSFMDSQAAALQRTSSLALPSVLRTAPAYPAALAWTTVLRGRSRTSTASARVHPIPSCNPPAATAASAAGLILKSPGAASPEFAVRHSPRSITDISASRDATPTATTILRDRLTAPLLRTDGGWRKSPGRRQFHGLSRRLLEIRDRFGPQALGAFTSSRSTNEAAYLLQKLFRTCIGTNNVDCCARVCHSSTALALQTVTGTGAATASYADIPLARNIVLGRRQCDRSASRGRRPHKTSCALRQFADRRRSSPNRTRGVCPASISARNPARMCRCSMPSPKF